MIVLKHRFTMSFLDDGSNCGTQLNLINDGSIVNYPVRDGSKIRFTENPIISLILDTTEKPKIKDIYYRDIVDSGRDTVFSLSYINSETSKESYEKLEVIHIDNKSNYVILKRTAFYNSQHYHEILCFNINNPSGNSKVTTESIYVSRDIDYHTYDRFKTSKLGFKYHYEYDYIFNLSLNRHDYAVIIFNDTDAKIPMSFNGKSLYPCDIPSSILKKDTEKVSGYIVDITLNESLEYNKYQEYKSKPIKFEILFHVNKTEE